MLNLKKSTGRITKFSIILVVALLIGTISDSPSAVVSSEQDTNNYPCYLSDLPNDWGEELMLARQADNMWQDICVDMLRDEVHRIMGEPDGMLSGLFGDIYELGDGSAAIIYYDVQSKVCHIKFVELPVELPIELPVDMPVEVSPVELPVEKPVEIPVEMPADIPVNIPINEGMELIVNADLDRDGFDESIFLDKTKMDSTLDVTLCIINGNGCEIWAESANTAHAGWNSLFLLGQDGEYFLLRYNPTIYQGYGTYVYTLFTLEGGKEKIYRTNWIEFDTNGTQKLDVPKMIAFADEVNSLLHKSILLMSTKDGVYTFDPSAEPFYERYSWLELMPELYEDDDDSEMRLMKYSDYVVSKRTD